MPPFTYTPSRDRDDPRHTGAGQRGRVRFRDRPAAGRLAPDIHAFERRPAQGEYDFASMNPYHHTLHSVAPGDRAPGDVVEAVASAFVAAASREVD